EFGVAVGRPAAEAEGPRLKSAAAAVPQVMTIGEPQAVNIGANREGFLGAQYEFAESVTAVHGIEERETSVGARRGQHGEERAVRAVGSVPVAAGVIVTAAEPRPRTCRELRLPAGFGGERSGTLVERTP